MTGSSLSAPDPLLERARGAYDHQRYARVVELLEGEPTERLLAAPELGYLLAASCREVGRPEQALELARRLRAPCRVHGTARLRRRRQNLEGMLLFDAGSPDQAERAWLGLLDDASGDDDPLFVAHACNNLGVVYTLQARVDEALTGYERALAAYRQMGDDEGVARANQNLGIVYREKDRPDDSNGHFLRAREGARALDLRRLLGRIEAERALLLVRQGDTKMADATAARAEESVAGLNDPVGLGEARRARGVVAAARGEADAGRALLSQARALARDAGNALLAAECDLALGLLASDDAEGGAVERAHHAFEAMGAGAWGRQMEHWLAELAERHH